MTATRKWSLLAAALVVAIVAAGWFLLIAPKRSEAAAIRADAASKDSANAQLVQQLEILKAQQADLPRKRARLATLGKLIPSDPALPTLVRNLSAAGKKAGVTIVSLEPALPVPLVQATAPVAATTTDTRSADTSSSDTSAGSATKPRPVAPPAPALYQVPLKVTLTGSYFELEQFVSQVERLKRAFQVTGFTLEPPTDSKSQDDLQLTLDSRVFLSPAEANAATTSVSTTGASASAGQ
jgi:type IV pilus assembly protein PilO